MKKLSVLAIVIAVALMLGITPALAADEGVQPAGGTALIAASGLQVQSDGDETTICSPLGESNIDKQSYYVYARPVRSYLMATSNGYMSLQGFVNDTHAVVSYYDSNFVLQSRLTLDEELPIFGGFYATDTNFYLVTGQNNLQESDSVEVYRITKYDRNWTRIGSCGLFGANTYAPFDAGSCRMDSTGSWLVVRTCHEMYASNDGLHHQANVTILVNTDSMTITDSFTDVMNNDYGYVSHSFNQFVKIVGNKIVSVDHGDASPRSICLMRYPTDITSGTFQVSYGNYVNTLNVITIPGQRGNNYTGASVGAFEMSDSSYLIAGNSVIQDERNTARTVRNIFVAAVDRETSAVNLNWFTNYVEDEESISSPKPTITSNNPDIVSTPHLVSIGANRFMLLWSYHSTVYYALIDGSGARISETYSFQGLLSDCVPIVSGNAVVWVARNNSEEFFYRIPLDNISSPSATSHDYSHDYTPIDVANGIVTAECTKCGEVVSGKVPTSFTVYWRDVTSTSSMSSSVPPSGLEAGSQLEYHASLSYSADSETSFDELVYESSDPQNCVIDTLNSKVSFAAPGQYTIRVYPKLNPSVVNTYRITIVKELESVTLAAEQESPVQYGSTVRLVATAEGGKGNLKYEFVSVGADGSQTVLRASSTQKYFYWSPEAAGTYTLRVNVIDPGDNNKAMSSQDLQFVVEPADIQPRGTALTVLANPACGSKARDAQVRVATFVASNTGKVVSGTLGFDEPDAVLTDDTCEQAWTFTPDDSNYKTYSGTATFQVVHDFEWAGMQGESALLECSSCGKSKLARVPVAFTPYWRNNSTSPSGGYSSRVPDNLEVGHVVGWMISGITLSTEGETVTNTFAVVPDDPTTCSVDASARTLTFSTIGEHTVTIYPVYNPDLKKTVTFTVYKPLESVALSADLASPQEPGRSVTLTATPEGGKRYVYYQFALVDADGNETVLRSYNASNSYTWRPGEAGVFRLRVTARDNLDQLYVTSEDLTFTIVERHSITEVRNKAAATCTEPGYTGDEYCTICGALLKSGSTIAALGHECGAWTETKAATCTEAGEKQRACSRCSFVETEVVSALGHDCGAWTETKAATCTEVGERQRTCSRCSFVETEVVSALGHDYADVVTAPTCTEGGYTKHTCSRCGDSYTDTQVAATGHRWGAWSVSREATISAAGEEKRTCAGCGRAETRAIPKLVAPKLPASVSGEVSPSNPVAAAAVDKQVTSAKSDDDQKGSTYGLLQARGVANSKSAVKLTWKKVSGAKSYAVYGNKCGKANKYKLITIVNGTSFTQKKLKKGTYYKYLVVALDGNAALATSKTIHVATKGGKVGNAKSVKVTNPKKAKATLAVGKTLTVKTKVVAQSAKLKIKNHRKVAFETSDERVATVTAKGKIKAVGKGACFVYAYAQNGVVTKIKVTVK